MKHFIVKTGKCYNKSYHNKALKYFFNYLIDSKFSSKCNIVDEEGNAPRQTPNTVEPIKEFEDKPHLLIAKLLKITWLIMLHGFPF